MKRLFQRNLNRFNTFTLLSTILVAILLPQSVEAQFRLPKIFNRDNNDNVIDPRVGRPTSRPGTSLPTNRSSQLIDRADRPIPYSVRINALKGYESSFGLSSKTSIEGKRVEYLIRDFPTAGKLVGLLSNPKNRSNATVTYYADPDSAATLDSFTFVARYPGGEYSEPARCEINIQDAQASIEVATPAVHFGNVSVGDTAVEEVHIINKGNAPYITKIDLFSPWKVANPPSGQIAIPAKSRTSIQIEFTPTIAGEVSHHIPFGSGEKGFSKLTAVAIEPFSTGKESWELTLNKKTREREVTIPITNNLKEPTEVFLRVSSRLKIEGRQTRILKPQTEHVVTVKLPASDVAPIDGGMEIKTHNGYSSITKITAKTVPGEIKVEIPNQIAQDVINFGRVKAGRSLEKNIIVKNLGGELVAVNGVVEEPFRILTRVDRQLGPQESLPVTIGYYPGKTDKGGADQFAIFEARNQTLKVRLLGIAMESDIAATSPPAATIPSGNSRSTNTTGTAANTSKPDSTAVTEDIEIEQLPKQRTIVDDLYSPEDLHLIHTKPRSAEISWTAPRDADIATFELEIRSPQTAHRSWAPHSSIEIKTIDRLVKANITDLNPKTGYEFRVFTVDFRGRSSAPSTVISSETPASKTWLYLSVLGLLIVVGVLAWVYFILIHKASPNKLKSEYLKKL